MKSLPAAGSEPRTPQKWTCNQLNSGRARRALARGRRSNASGASRSLSVKRTALSRRCRFRGMPTPRGARSDPDELVHVVVEARATQVQQQLRLPRACEVEADMRDALEVIRQFDAVLVEHAHATRAQRGNEEAHLEDDFLVCARGEERLAAGLQARTAAVVGPEPH